MDPSAAGIYAITNKENGKMYIGSGPMSEETKRRISEAGIRYWNRRKHGENSAEKV